MASTGTEKTLFKRIIDGEIPCDKVYEDEDVLAFRDIDPKAPVHVLVIPKQEVASIADVADDVLAGKVMRAAARIARELGLEENGYRLVTNVGDHGGQSVFHWHVHLLGGRQLQWPPG
ncbi:MAG: histidine triad nucleotide-binding protein [Cyanobacteria bacterium HKST-UBA06]|nr:histidine triad nucleotide-binding protein [Cyanobacteria bacterium HKST-UBA04]MCA9806431.1 histidine triad nucleotide-binding protein [Cyanobacteria bacterium HKST-UBA06]MCA9840565.1 histidine triad nucleotide-binding protein [Cyanobacteria bacterium HKST-UBA03]